MESPDSHESSINNHRLKFLALTRQDHTCTIDNLPVELLSRIFEFGGGKKGGEGGYQGALKYSDGFEFHPIELMAPAHGRHPPSFRIAVSLVCHHWYNVAVSTPSLWTSLRLAFWDSFEQLQTMLGRSKGLPLDAHFSYYNEADPPVYEVSIYGHRLEQRYLTLVGALAPRLRSIHLSHCCLDWSSSWISSLSNLTTLEFESHIGYGSPSWSQFIAILRASPALKKLVLHSAGPQEGPDSSDHESTGSDDTMDPAALVPLLNLTELVLADETPEFAEGLLRTVYIPALRNLSLDVAAQDYSTFIELLAGPVTVPTGLADGDVQYSLLNRIENLYIPSLAWPGDDSDYVDSWEVLYDGLHNLKLLSITVSESTMVPEQLDLLRLLRAYTPPGQVNPTVRLPRLETLIVSNQEGSITLIHEVVMSRIKAGFPLKSLYIQRSDNEEVKELGRSVEGFRFF